MNNGFSLYEQPTVTNQEIRILYRPESYVSKYTYEIIKDGEVYETYQVGSMKTSEILLTESGEYQIRVTLYQGRNTVEKESGIYLLDMDKPIIRLKDTSYENLLIIDQVKDKENFNINDYIIATDNYDGDVINNVTSNIDEIDVTALGLHELVYTVTDSAGNIATKTVNLNITKDNSNSLMGMQLILLAIFTIMIGYFLRYRHSMKLEKRIAKYSIHALRDRSLSVIDKLGLFYQKQNQKFANILSKSVYLERYSKRYEKYIPLYKPFYKTEMEFVSLKFFVSIIFLIIAFVTKTFQFEMMKFYEIMVPLLCGFFAPDLLFFSKYKIYRNTMENDLLQAIIIMNNAFKSGRSIKQAIELVTKELEGPISEEFKKMSLELSFGLSIEEVFRRFADRVKLEEINYLTASLTILNKTGGNIIQVFSSIEKTLFNKKKLKLELASLTGSSKIIVYVLFFVPLMFIIFISLVNPTYFEPFYTTTIGMILAGIMLLIYVVYIWAVRKIMKVRM